MRRYKLLDHTADIGIIVSGRDLPEVFGNAAYAMFDILTDVDSVRQTESYSLRVSAENVEDLLVAWLSELLYRYETERVIFSKFAIDDISNGKLSATIFGEKIALGRHEIKTEIKSVTYHQLRVERTGDGWEAQVIFDV